MSGGGRGEVAFGILTQGGPKQSCFLSQEPVSFIVTGVSSDCVRGWIVRGGERQGGVEA